MRCGNEDDDLDDDETRRALGRVCVCVCERKYLSVRIRMDPFPSNMYGE